MNLQTNVRNELLKRREVRALLEAQSNPGFAQAQTALAQTMKVQEEVIALKNVRSQFGSKTFIVEACVYDSLEDKQRIEPKVKVAAKKGVA